MMRKNTRNNYFEWLYDFVCGDRFSKDISYRKLLRYLFDREFIFSISRDANRALDGMDLRYRFFGNVDLCDIHLDGPCSVLEMMIALAIRCEENIMDDPNVGDRTGQWFWGMINNLGLGAMDDSIFDRVLAKDVVDTFLYRKYEPNGRGGLFTVRNCEFDLRTVEIWHQLCWYLDGITTE